MIERITRNWCFRYSICLLLVAILCGGANGQNLPEPEREQLLNGLRIIFWQRPGDANVLLKLRINSGAAFDLAGKDGTMALLGEALFPDPATREYVTEQLGGKLEVATGYDQIDLTMSGTGAELERMVELVRAALLTTQLSPENVARLREAKIKELSDKPASKSQLADRAIAARLFGNFPYGRPPGGSVASVAKIERADLMLARERFLNADNATLVVIGGVTKSRVMRTLRQLLGPWQKSDRTVPATFRQPTSPDARILVLNQTGETSAEIRLAVRGFARADRDSAAAALLAQIVRARWQAAVPDLSSGFARHDPHALPGSFMLGGSTPNASAAKAIDAAEKILLALAQNGPTASELDTARSTILGELGRRASQTEAIADAWLNVETYKLPPANSEAGAISSLTVGDLQRVAGRLFKNASLATAVVGDFEQLKSAFGNRLQLLTSEADVKKEVQPLVPTKKP